jgi:hypothetical protein
MPTQLHDCDSPDQNVTPGKCAWVFHLAQKDRTHSGWVLQGCNCQQGQKCPEPDMAKPSDGAKAETDCQ